jgi:hypothetical protein
MKRAATFITFPVVILIAFVWIIILNLAQDLGKRLNWSGLQCWATNMDDPDIWVHPEQQWCNHLKSARS